MNKEKSIVKSGTYVLKCNLNPKELNILVQNVAVDSETGEEMVIYNIYFQTHKDNKLWCERKCDFLNKYTLL